MMSFDRIKPGDTVEIEYLMQETIVALVIENDGHWLLVEQVSGYPNPEERPRFEALASKARRIVDA